MTTAQAAKASYSLIGTYDGRYFHLEKNSLRLHVSWVSTL